MIRRIPDLSDLDHEIREHIEQETLDNIARGMSDVDARLAAVRKFGNVTRVKEDVRGVMVPRWLDEARQDARDAIRTLRRRPSVTLAIVLTLALGIGLATAIYSVVNAVLLRPLDYAHPDRVMWLTTRGKESIDIVSSIDLAGWQSEATSMSRIVAYNYIDSTLVLGGEASRIRILNASDGLWEITGARALFGTLPSAPDPPAIALSHRVFIEQFHGDPSIIGQAVTVDGRNATIAAVLPENFRPQLVGRPLDLAFNQEPIGAYRLMRVQPPPPTLGPATQVQVYQVLGELKTNVSLEAARAEIETIHHHWQREHPSMGASSAVVTPLRDKIVGPSRLPLGLLLSASIVVLLIGCANVAILLLSQSSERRQEIALRMSIGSGPGRIIRQLLAESLSYAIVGGVGGVLFASWLVNAMVLMMAPAVPRLAETTLNLGVLVIAAAVSIGTALVFGVSPAITLVFTNVREALRDGGRTASASRRVLVAGRIMAATQVAMTIVLLAGAGLVFKSVWQMTRYPSGFEPAQILTMRLAFRGPQYSQQLARHALATALLAKARTLPEVRDAAITTGRESVMIVLKENEPIPPPEARDGRQTPISAVSANFGRLLGMSIVSGRWPDELETDTAIINDTLARRAFPNSDPLGSRIKMPTLGTARAATIVGVVHDLKYAEIDKDAVPEVFFQYSDLPLASITLMLRIAGDPLAAAPGIRKALSSVDPTQSFYSIQTLEQALAASIVPRRFNLLVLGTFAFVALTLAVLGVYGVVAHSVAERTQEIGIRLALGAKRSQVVRMIIAQGMSGILVGIAAGFAGAWSATRLVGNILYGVQPHDRTTFAIATVLLSSVALIACAAPAFKAAGVDPVVALKAD